MSQKNGMTERDNQIEEMAREVMGGCEECSKCPLSFDCKAYEYATKFYNAGYRKQAEGEWIFKEYGEDTYTNLTRIYECSLCGRTIECLNEADEPYCHCGARMRVGE